MMGDAYHQGPARRARARRRDDGRDRRGARARSLVQGKARAFSKIPIAASARTFRTAMRSGARVAARRRSNPWCSSRTTACCRCASRGRIALIGPMCDAPADQLGAWASAGAAEDSITILEGVRARLSRRRKSSLPKAADRRSRSRAGIAAARDRCGAGGCRAAVPGRGALRDGRSLQPHAAGTAATARSISRAKSMRCGKPVVLALAVSRPLVLPDWLVEGASAILITWHAGSETGPAFADLVSGAVKSFGQALRVMARDARPDAGLLRHAAHGSPARSRPTAGRPVSSTRRTRHAGASAKGSATHVSRARTCARQRCNKRRRRRHGLARRPQRRRAWRGRETLFLFIRDPVARVTRPILELKDFTRVELAPGESRAVHFVLRASGLFVSRRKPEAAPRRRDHPRSTSAQARGRTISTASTCASKTAPLRSANLTGA